MMENKTVELKPCPFCGTNARILKREVGSKGTMGYDWWHGIQCAGCNSAVGYDDNRYRDKQDAIKAWNTRTPAIDPALMGEMVELVKSLELELVQGDSINRTNPCSLQKVNSNGSWLVTKEYKAAHKAKTTLEKISSILARMEENTDGK